MVREKGLLRNRTKALGVTSTWGRPVSLLRVSPEQVEAGTYVERMVWGGGYWKGQPLGMSEKPVVVETTCCELQRVILGSSELVKPTKIHQCAKQAWSIAPG